MLRPVACHLHIEEKEEDLIWTLEEHRMIAYQRRRNPFQRLQLDTYW